MAAIEAGSEPGLCFFCRDQWGALWWDGDRNTGRSCCWGCLEALLERELALQLAAELGVELQLPPLFDRKWAPVRPGPRPPRARRTSEKLERLREQWDAYVASREREALQDDALGR